MKLRTLKPGFWTKTIIVIASLHLCGCATGSGYKNAALPNSAQVWVGEEEGKGLWSAMPGDSSLGIHKLDGKVAGFPPGHFMGFGPIYEKPLYLAPGVHSLIVEFEHDFYDTAPTNPPSQPTTVTFNGSGTITADFSPLHQYRITALFGERKFTVTLWDVTGDKMPGISKQTWEFGGSQITGRPY
jgi:hypothetical protein